MEANQITCPQCGLVNNELAEACVQCGIIFVKNPAMQAPTMPDEQKRKAIEEAEAMLDETQASPEIDAFGNELIKRPDPHEDTIEMQIPTEETTDIKPETSAPEEPKPEENKNSGNHEIELEAIEAAVETVNETAGAEALFLSAVSTGKPAEPTAPETAGATVGMPAQPEKANDQSGETGKSDTNSKDSQDHKAEALPVKPLEGNPMAEPQKEENRVEKEPEETKSEAAEPAKTEAAAADAVESAKSEDNSTCENTTQPAEQEIQLEEKPELTMAEEAPAQAEPQTHAAAKKEMPKEPVDEDSQIKQKEQQVREALKKQREAQAKAEAQEREKTAQAQAVAVKKKKLARAKAAAFKKQKAAQAKAEALKKKKEVLAKVQASKKQEAARAKADALNKQKEAQAKAEASSQEMQVGSTGMPQAAAESTNHHERLLGLLKRYKGKAIGINYDNSSEIKEAELVDANEEFFSVMVKDKKLQYSYPLKTILTIVEGQEGVETGEDDKKTKFDAVIKVYPLVLF
jgi:hypothetical protein